MTKEQFERAERLNQEINDKQDELSDLLEV